MDLAKSKQFDHLEGWMLFNKRDTIVTVKDVTEGQIDSFQTGGKIDKYMLHFEESSKTLPLNKTNLKTIIVLMGSTETDDWKGRRLALYSEWVKVGGKQVLGVRIRDTEPPPRQPTRRETKTANGKKATPPTPPEETRDPVEIDLLAEVNAQCNNRYQRINHLLNGAKKVNPDIDPDNLADPDNVKLIKAAAIEYANVPDVLPQPDAPTGEPGQPSLLADAPAPYPD